MKPRVRRTNQMFTIWNPQHVVSESISILVPGLGLVLGHLQTVQTQIRLKFRYGINEKVLSPRSGLFSRPTVRDNLPTSVVSALITRKITLVTSCLHSCTPRPFWKVRAIFPIYSRSFSEGRQNLWQLPPQESVPNPLESFRDDGKRDNMDLNKRTAHSHDKKWNLRDLQEVSHNYTSLFI